MRCKEKKKKNKKERERTRHGAEEREKDNISQLKKQIITNSIYLTLNIWIFEYGKYPNMNTRVLWDKRIPYEN